MIQEYEMYYKNSDGERREDVFKFHVLITTYECVINDIMDLKDISWRACVIDEAHRLKNQNCKLLEGLKLLDIEARLLLSGTPLQNNINELFSLLSFLEPTQFNSITEFMKDFGDMKKEGQVVKLQALLKPLMLRRMKEDVEKSLKPKEETIVEVELTNIQKKYYRGILEKNFSFLAKSGTNNVPNLMNTMMELRKCCIHPYLLNGAEEQIQGDYMSKKNDYSDDEDLYYKALVHASGKMVLLDKLLPKLKANGHRVLIFSQMVRMLDILEDYLIRRKYPFERIDGRIRGNLRQAAIDRYCRPDSDRFVFLLCTKAGGLGINLTAADTCIIYDSDWNPQNDLQAQARCHRIGQKEQVNVYRLVTKNSVEEEIIERAKKKMVLDHLVIQRMDTTGRTILKNAGHQQDSNKQGNPFNNDELSSILKFGAEELFKEDLEKGEETHCDIDEILRVAETRTEEATEADDDLMSGFKSVSLNLDEDEAVADAKESGIQKLWDEIIPADLLDELEEEEKQKELADMYLGPRQRKTVLGEKTSNGSSPKKKKRKRSGSSEESGSKSDDPDSETQFKKKQRKSGVLKDFNDGEIRRFVKSYKKFPLPLTRMEDIGCDAELRDKGTASLLELGRHLHERCVEALGGEDASAMIERPESIKLGNVSVNPKTLLEIEALLNPLGKLMPEDAEERKSWTVEDISFKDAHFDVSWSLEEDSKLLVGICEQVKSDKVLELGDKILLNASCKPRPSTLTQ